MTEKTTEVDGPSVSAGGSDVNPIVEPTATKGDSASAAFAAELTPSARTYMAISVNQYSISLEQHARMLANKDEAVVERHVRDAELAILTSSVGTGLASAVTWLRSLTFLFTGLGIAGLTEWGKTNTLSGWTLLESLLAAACLGGAAALEGQSMRIKRWVLNRRRKNT